MNIATSMPLTTWIFLLKSSVGIVVNDLHLSNLYPKNAFLEVQPHVLLSNFFFEEFAEKGCMVNLILRLDYHVIVIYL